MTAPYDAIADWYEDSFRPGQPTDLLVYDGVVPVVLGAGSGPCLEVGCGTGAHADRIRRLGWTPVGVDLSAGMLRRGRGRLPAARADAERLPVADASVPAVASIMVHTDMPGYPAVLREAARVLRSGGVLAHVGVHPCFCGGFADWSDRPNVLIRPGYADGHWTTESYTDKGIRDKVGASHWPLSELLQMVLAAGLELERFAEGGHPVPLVLALRARKPERRGAAGALAGAP
jgi:SAM-dependent methyltransferase